MEFVGHVQQRQERHQAVVTIGLNEVMPRDGCGVDVVLPEWPDEGLGWTEDRWCLLSVKGSPCPEDPRHTAGLACPWHRPAWAEVWRAVVQDGFQHWWKPSPILLGLSLRTHTVRALETIYTLEPVKRPYINKGDPVYLLLKPLLLEAAFRLSVHAAKWSLL